MTRYILIFISLLVMSSCFEPNNVDTSIKVEYGTSFGFCVGYCTHVLEIDVAGAVLTRIDRREEIEDEVYSKELTAQDFEKLIMPFENEAFMELPEVIGCPDCADGGAEWIRISKGNESKKVTFEYNDNLDGNNEFLKNLRELFADLKPDN